MDWQTTRNRFMKATGGDPPSQQLETELIRAYNDHPQAVTRTLEKIAMAHAAGKVRSPWGAARAELAKATDPANNPTPDTGTQRLKAIQRAEQWIRTAGAHYDRWTEVHDDLFGTRGIVKAHHTPELETKLLELWESVRVPEAA